MGITSRTKAISLIRATCALWFLAEVSAFSAPVMQGITRLRGRYYVSTVYNRSLPRPSGIYEQTTEGHFEFFVLQEGGEQLLRLDRYCDSASASDRDLLEMQHPAKFFDDWQRTVRLPDKIIQRDVTNNHPLNSIHSASAKGIGGALLNQSVVIPIIDPSFLIYPPEKSLAEKEESELPGGSVQLSYFLKNDPYCRRVYVFDPDGGAVRFEAYSIDPDSGEERLIVENDYTYETAGGVKRISSIAEIIYVVRPDGVLAFTHRSMVKFDLPSIATEALDADLFTFKGIGADLNGEGWIDYSQDPAVSFMTEPESRRIMLNIEDIALEPKLLEQALANNEIKAKQAPPIELRSESGAETAMDSQEPLLSPLSRAQRALLVIVAILAALWMILAVARKRGNRK